MISIGLVIILLGICMSVDYATNYTEDNSVIEANQTLDMTNFKNATYLNGTHYVLDNGTGIARLHKIVHIKPKYPTISMWAKPSCGCRNSYRWHYRTFVNYCPHCKHYGTLRKNPKGVYEKEYTCVIDDCDYCAVCGKEKYSWSHYYLRRA